MNTTPNRFSVDLGGSWQFAFSHVSPSATQAGATSPGSKPAQREFRSLAEVAEAGLTLHPCKVPGNFELDLQALGLMGDPYLGLNILGLRTLEDCHLWYGATFNLPTPPAGCEADLVFEGLDCCAEVFVNREKIGVCDNMLVEQVLPLDGRLRAGRNELLVHIRPAVAAANDPQFPYPVGAMASVDHDESLYIRKAPHMYGWDIMPRAVSAGIWRPVSMRFRPIERLEETYLETRGLREDGTAQLKLYARTNIADFSSGPYELAVSGRCGESTFQHAWPIHCVSNQFLFDLPNAKLWWPRGYGEQNLYDVAVELRRAGRVIDADRFTFGPRTAALERTSVTTPDGQGQFRFLVNSVPIFCKGSNWVPLDAFHSRDASRLDRAFEMVVDLDCNILRCWGGNVYESNRFFELCDRNGVLVWQDFAMACAFYPQDDLFQRRLAAEAECVVRRLRQHPSLLLWSGDNECDAMRMWLNGGDPNRNLLTRKVLVEVVAAHDPARPYLPSSPYIDEQAWQAGAKALPEDHLWGPRNYYKSAFYREAVCHFVSEIGYHGCPAPASVRKFITPDKVWPCVDNDEWTLHSTNPAPSTAYISPPDYRVKLMLKQVESLFGQVPATFEDFAFTSQAVQAEAKKFFIERFRSTKWRRTGIIWWNLLDGWPQFSDAVVDWYYVPKLAYHFIKAAQQRVCLMVSELAEGQAVLVASNDTMSPATFSYTVTDLATGGQLAAGQATVAANAALPLCDMPAPTQQAFWVIRWQGDSANGANHYLAGKPPFDWKQYLGWLKQASLYSAADLTWVTAFASMRCQG